MKTHQLIIIGAGPIGLACGIAATKADLDYVILEKGVLVNSLYHFPEQMTFFYLKSTGNREVPFVSHSDKPTRKEALEYFRRVHDSWKLNIDLYTAVERMEKDGDAYVLKTSKGDFRTEAVIVSTGYYDTARKLHIPGENLPKVKHFYDSPHPYVDQDVLVIGAANSACDVALETYYKGAHVTMAIRGSEIYKKPNTGLNPILKTGSRKAQLKPILIPK